MPAGASTGIISALNTCSVWCGRVEDLAAWSSPAITSTPPCCEVPAALAWRKTSQVRSTPGPLPYQMENTPSTLALGSRPSCCVPHTEVAARSSLSPGWKRMFIGSRKRFAFQNSWSTLPSGEPR